MAIGETTNNGDTPSFQRLLGRLEHAVKTLEDQLPTLATNIERERTDRQAACAEHWKHTNSLTNAMLTDRASREAVTAAAKAAADTINTAAADARQTLIAAATERQASKHWLIERFLQAMPVLWAALAMALGYWVLK